MIAVVLVACGPGSASIPDRSAEQVEPPDPGGSDPVVDSAGGATAETGDPTGGCPWAGEWEIAHVCGGDLDDRFRSRIGTAVVESVGVECAVHLEAHRLEGCDVREDVRLTPAGYGWTGSSSGGDDEPADCYLGGLDPYDLGVVTIDELDGQVELTFERSPYVSADCAVGGFTLSNGT